MSNLKNVTQKCLAHSHSDRRTDTQTHRHTDTHTHTDRKEGPNRAAHRT